MKNSIYKEFLNFLLEGEDRFPLSTMHFLHVKIEVAESHVYAPDIWFLGRKGVADPTFAAAKVKSAIGKIGISFLLSDRRTGLN